MLKGFPTKWNDWIMHVVSGGKVCVKVNGDIGPYFRTFKGLSQGDPLSPLLFNLVVDILAHLIRQARELGLVKSINSFSSTEDTSILQYADDTIFLIHDDVESAKNLKFILCLFEHLSGFKINFLKSEVYCGGSASINHEIFEEIFTCKGGNSLLNI